MAHARTLKKQNYDVVAVIGDGALTGGLAYEGLSNLGGGSEPMVVILNDNGMSINGNVGGMAKLLSRERIKPGYINFKRWYRSTVGNVPQLYNANHKLKEALKKTILPSNIFDAMGVSSAWIGRRLVEIVDRCMQATPHLTRNPETKQREPDGVWEFDPAGAMRALHELDEHLRSLREEEAAEGGALSFEEWLARQEGASGL